MGNPSCLVLLSFLIFNLFVAEIYGNKQGKALDKLQESKFKASSKADKSPFMAQENIVLDEVVHSQDGLKEKDKIEKLPGQTNVTFSQYGGYITVDKLAGRSFYYYFVEADHPSNETLPLLLWLNGGPGCSSLAYGAMQELGPFRVNSDGKTLQKNTYSWNNASNVLFVESPAGVGFSYSNTSSDYEITGDKKTAEDNYVFLVNWLERFPEYKTRDFYIAGESYAGHYVPQLAQNIIYNNKKANRTIVNLKGIMIGNAVLNDETDHQGMYDFLATHAFLSDETAQYINTKCNFSTSTSNQTTECNEAGRQLYKNTFYIDVYNIYAPSCINRSLTAYPKNSSDVHDPCSDAYVRAYLNRGDVQEALHANVTKLKYDWEPCSDNVSSHWGDSPSTVLPILQDLLNSGLRVWIISGDIDSVVPVTSTKYSLKQMKLPIETVWYPWIINEYEVGGFGEVYKGGLTFATVREAGHQVPSYQPARALSLLKFFLQGALPPFPN